MKHYIFSITLIVAIINCTLPSYSQTAKSGIENSNNTNDRNDFSFESSPLMKKLFYPRPQRMAVIGKDINVNGAWGTLNRDFDSLKTGRWFIEEQRSAADAIIAGIIQDNEAVIERGMMALEWGAKQQQTDGSFNCSDNFHSTSFYVEAVAHSCILLKRSKYYSLYQERIEKLKTSITNTVNWMLKPEVLVVGKKRNEPYTHRRYLVAAAIGEAGVLCNNNNFIKQSSLFIYEGLSLQDTAGVNPEKTGYDCSYQAVGLLFAHRYFDIVADEKQKEALLLMFEKGFKWLLSRIDENGKVNGVGNTRTGFGQEKVRSGKPKGISFGAIANSLIWWGIYQNDTQLQILAEKVFTTGRYSQIQQLPALTK